MTSHATISPQEAADRLAIRDLIDAYAHCADRRDAKRQMALFTDDTRFLVFMDAAAAEPTQELHGRESLAPVFDDLNQYNATMHFNGQSVVSLDGDRASPLGGPGRAAHDDDRVHPVSRRVRQAGRRVVVRRAPADGQLDRNTAVRGLRSQPGRDMSWPGDGRGGVRRGAEPDAGRTRPGRPGCGPGPGVLSATARRRHSHSP
jgi:ketosteroid isomerase-like protein